jgi:DNA-binding MarR family transcriptional regulator
MGFSRWTEIMPANQNRTRSKPTSSQGSAASANSQNNWTFLSNHGHVLICLAQNPEMRLRDIAIAVGITERAVIRIITELQDGGYVSKERIGRRNRYTVKADKPLRHRLEAHHSVKTILSLAK